MAGDFTDNHGVRDRKRKVKLPGIDPGTKFPNLEYLIGTYFHQDWGLDFNNDSDLVRFFANENSKARVEGCLGEIQELVASKLSHEQVAYLLEEKFFGNVPYGNCNEVRPWLENVAKALRQSIHFG